MKSRVGQRSYQRGVHRGERIDPSDYYYPAGFEPDRGIKRQMRGVVTGNVISTKRHTETAKLAPAPHLPNDGKAGPSIRSNSPMAINKKRTDQWARVRPDWK